MTSTVRHKKVVCSGRQRFAFVSPPEWLSHGATVSNFLLDHLLRQVFGTPVADGSSIFLGGVAGQSVELGDLLQVELGGVPERSASFRRSTTDNSLVCNANHRRRHRRQVSLVIPSPREISPWLCPPAARKMILARITSC